MAKERIFGLDIVRALAIMLVIFSHGAYFLKDINALLLITDGGYWGVELFFVLSGFLIGGILIKLHADKNLNKLKDLIAFWKRRWFRTLPNYYLFFSIFTIYTAIKVGHLDPNFNFLFFTQNFSTIHPNFFPVAWSLAIEEWFYLLFPLLMLLTFKIFKKHKPHNIIIISLIFIIIINLIRFEHVALNNPSYDAGVRKVVLFRLDAIIYGVIVAYYYKFHLLFLIKIKKLLFTVGTIIITLLLYYLYTHLDSIDTNLFLRTSFFSLTDIGLAMMLPVFAEIKEDIIHGSWITFISKISYSLYLVHSFIITLAIDLSLQSMIEKPLDSLFLFSTYLFLSILISWLLYKYYEVPIMNKRDKCN